MLQKQKVKSCGCQKGLILSQYRVKESGKEGLNPLYFKRLAQYKTDCNQFNTEWGLTDAKAIDMFQLPCAYCGRRLYSETYIQGVNIEFPCNGLDKVDPTGGYTEANVVTACDDCNTAKTNLPLETFLHWRQRIVNNHTKIVELIQSKIDQK